YTGNAAAGITPYNSIRFEYQDRADAVPFYDGGALTKVTKLLIGIKSYADNDIVRSYTLIHDNGAEAGASRLLSVQECGSDGSCFPATYFNGWQSSNRILQQNVSTLY